ncbi:uncharacterized protein PFL1_05222 [Pseudozyma flocculosa PF-1]|uniref:Uncharacterized protein n=2 Tax=Pseudozyma flocculosa TaxID=84751 RepID=A0A5C3F698_9BASI|nr:uncharacterized protein PFL1_05222 [Pseudozyma flocculosa PF-1]EPQ27299.1 hypothetical protein PFL1_05222 [Pseudozyma flocculosa PF-1]SPO39670.1 uncharacterized protein PSFLO_05151 [Pseudozyma flocculosa]
MSTGSPRRLGLGLGLDGQVPEEDEGTDARSATASPSARTTSLRHAGGSNHLHHQRDHLQATHSPTRRRADGTNSMASSSFLSPLRSRAGSLGEGDASGDAAGSDYAESIADTTGGGGGGDQSMSMLSTADPAEIDELEEGVRQSRTIEDFTKIISEFRLNRKSTYAESLAVNTETGSQWGGARSDDGATGSDAGSISASTSLCRRRRSISGESGSDYGGASATRGRCTCCCGRDDCPSAIRARQEWRDLEADLRLSAEIGQALLKRHDAMHARSQKQAQEYIQQRDGLMSRLTKSYKETSGLERQLAQANLNLEAADSSNRTLLHELDEVRGQLAKLRASQTRMAGAEDKAHRLATQLDDAKQELAAERKRADAAEARARKLSERNTQLAESLKQARKEVDIASIRRDAKVSVSEEALDEARRRLAVGMRQARSSESGKDGQVGGNGGADADDGGSGDEVASVVDTLVRDNEALRQGNAQLQELLEARTEELAAIREQADASSVYDHFSSSATPGASTTGAAASSSSPRPSMHSRPPSSLGFGSSYRVPSSSRRSDIDGGEGDEHDDDAALAPVTLSDEVVVPGAEAAATSNTTATSPLPGVTLTRTPSSARRSSAATRAQPARSYSRSSAASSVAAGVLDGSLQDSPRSMSAGLVPAIAGASHSSDTPVTRRPSRAEAGSEHTISAVGGGGGGSEHDAASATGNSAFLAEAARRERDNRTSQLATLLDYIQRLFGRLSSADVDTLTRRLQRQHLAGDVGHLARTTVNSILRDVDGLRDHFRRLVEQESRQQARDDSSMGSRDASSESLVSRKEFFAVLKAFRDILCEVARLRLCVNEIHMNPGAAAKLLQEHLGATAAEDRSLLPIPSAVGWLGKMLLGGPSSTGSSSTSSSSAAASLASASTGIAGAGTGTGPGSAAMDGGGSSAEASSSGAAGRLGLGAPSSSLSRPSGSGAGAGGRMQPTRAVSGGSAYASHLAPRASAAVVSSSVAVEVKGLHASAAEASNASSSGGTSSLASTSPPPSGGGLKAGPRPKRGRAPGSLSRVQSRNLSGLFAGTLGNPEGFGASPSGRHGPSLSSSSYTPQRRDASSLGSSLLASGSANRGAAQRPLSRIVDDDEVSLHHGRSRHHASALDTEDDPESSYPGALLERTLRPRGLSDSSIRSTFLDAGAPGGLGGGSMMGPSPVSRIITPATLALQYEAAAVGPADDDAKSDVSGAASASTATTAEKVAGLWRGAVATASGAAGSSSASSGGGGHKAVRQTPSVAALSRAAARAEEALVVPRGAASRGAF